MFKEITACIIIIISIFIFDNRTQAYTQKSVGETTEKLEQIRENLISEEKRDEDIQNDMDKLYKQWMEQHNKLAYYIEHDELEKVETQMVGLKGNIEVKEYEMAVGELDKCIFILEHIEDKYKFNLENVF